MVVDAADMLSIVPSSSLPVAVAVTPADSATLLMLPPSLTFSAAFLARGGVAAADVRAELEDDDEEEVDALGGKGW